jgi:LTXXQ motif family protein
VRQPPQIGALRPNGRPRMTPEAARQGRFASHFMQHAHPPRWRADRIPADLAWRRHHHAGFVAWAGPLFWPYVYTDLFYYPFWPDTYDDAYWPYVYDNFLDSVYWATGNPYSEYPYAAPTAVSVEREAAPRNRRQAGGAGASICGSDSGITAWPFARIESAVMPTAEQQAFLDEFKAAAAQSAADLKASCPQAAALTPTGRLDAMLVRLRTTLNASHTVHAPLMRFYDSLSDEQKARFNGLGPNAGPKAGAVELSGANACSGQKSGLADLPVEQVDDAVRPSEAQAASLDQLGKANGQAIAILQAACPDGVPQTPVGRLDAIEKRLDAMIQAAQAIQPALQAFYGSLTDEQKSRFNTLGQRAGG